MFLLVVRSEFLFWWWALIKILPRCKVPCAVSPPTESILPDLQSHSPISLLSRLQPRSQAHPYKSLHFPYTCRTMWIKPIWY